MESTNLKELTDIQFLQVLTEIDDLSSLTAVNIHYKEGIAQVEIRDSNQNLMLAFEGDRVTFFVEEEEELEEEELEENKADNTFDGIYFENKESILYKSFSNANKFKESKQIRK